MQVWIGFKQNEEYVHEWTGEGRWRSGGRQGHRQRDRRVSHQKRQDHLGNGHYGGQSATALTQPCRHLCDFGRTP